MKQPTRTAAADASRTDATATAAAGEAPATQPPAPEARAAEEHPHAGGSYIRQADGSLKREDEEGDA